MEHAEPQPAKPRKRYGGLIISVCIAMALVGGALYWRGVRASESKGTERRVFTLVQLAEFNGVDGKECYVAVHATVYKIQQGRLWKDGQHSSSKGQASCGRDLSDVIGESPHGTAKLSMLEVVGTLE